ncbi:MAG: glycosyltransferase family 4 protein [Desulfatibacillaceae bacterium]
MSDPVRKKRTICLVIGQLRLGGAQRVMTLMANHWVGQGDEVWLLTWEGEGVEPFFPLDPRVRLVRMDLVSVSYNRLSGLVKNARRIMVSRKSITRVNPDVVISFLDAVNVVTLLASRGLGIPVIVSERVDPSGGLGGPMWQQLARRVYPLADAVVVQTERIQEVMTESVRHKTRVIPNPVVMPSCEQSAVSDKEGGTVLGVGRLAWQKGFDTGLAAFSRMAADHPKWRYVIAGGGPEMEALRNLASELGIADRVEFSGEVRDMSRHYAEADLFLLSSRVEGFPNALCEAMAAGIPAVATDCPSGPREIIQHGVDGLLVPVDDEEAMADAMASLIRDTDRRRDMGAAAARIVDRFSVRAVMDMWDKLIREVS